MMRAESEVNAATRRQRISGRNGSNGDLREIEQFQEASQGDAVISAFPYLEKIGMVAKKNPYAMLSVIVGIAAIIAAAIVTLSISIIGAVFIMYGTMNRMQEQQDHVLKQLAVIQVQQKDDGNAMRAYEAANGKRIEFVVGLMTPAQQQRMNEYDRTHPIPLPPRKDN